MSRKVVVTGLGIVSALGLGVKQNIHALQNGHTGIAPIKYLQTRLRDKFVLGEVKYSNTDLKSILGIDEDELISRTSMLGILAVREAANMAGLTLDELKTCALVSGTTVGGMDLTEQIVDFDSEKDLHKVLNLHPCGDSTEKIASYLGIGGFVTTYSTACSSAANAIMMGARLIKSGRADRVIAGGTDALSCFTLNGFNSLLILDCEYCRPFDRSRAGLNLGEGAGFIVLEAEDIAKPNKALAVLSGYANANDAHHQTASSPEGIGASLSMQKAMEVAGLKCADISYINAHGTGTPNNDSSEARAIGNLFGDNPPFSSTKAFTGHTLGACGGIEGVFSIMAIQNQELYAGLNFSEADEDSHIVPIDQYEKSEIKHVLSNSFGFGGNNSSLVFSKI
ncbi:beta-ketoacyl-[acyl-carrier-protein] synthase family protein [Labilibaculum antarcticum]|uniref:Beta-ACP synthase n=1 Tax=Labilibaculum antarcticum TaxID=1717717 RepID=A0A1Y1CPU1_9BACT|nr:beta-ketoacyl-[acyl-carrier-protein] synthase family protein [Labilibaculum antarcticum]BAX82456.1 beta-ACP synthase [Labilibaculum antarcticum]